MDALHNFTRWRVPPSARAISLLLATLGVVVAAPTAAYAGPSGSLHSFALAGSASLKSNASVQTAGSLQLKATLSASGSADTTQQAFGYALTATLADAPLVCHYDTIFRDGFGP
ncbi:MAG: hypothetical protein WBV61_06685 [Rhodanobacteraceae bacterium]